MALIPTDPQVLSRLTALETKNAQQDARLTAIETKNTQQDVRLTALETPAALVESAHKASVNSRIGHIVDRANNVYSLA